MASPSKSAQQVLPVLLQVVVLLLGLCNGSALERYRSLIRNQSVPINLEAFPGELCLRSCDDTQPRVCYFNWVLEHYHAMGPACKACAWGNHRDCYHHSCLTADGVERGVMSINRQIPGPPIQVCKDDLIVVDMTNAMGGTATTMHWHGLHQRDTPYMDGVPFVTQCPIEFSSTFRYAFWATEPGTQFYHSHAGHHKVNGHYGAMIIRQPEVNDPNSHLYDFDFPDHTILGSDWMHVDGEMFMPGLPSSGGILPKNLLINGKGTYTNPNGTKTNAPLDVFRVRKGGRYRFRFINAASHVCPLELQVENHTLQIIASDSFNLQPLTVNTLVTTSGERYDFVLNADQPSANYWIRLRAIGPCDYLNIDQTAVLTYLPFSVPETDIAFTDRDIPAFSESLFEETISANHPNTTCGISKPSVCITDFEAYARDDSIVNGVPDHKFFLGFENYRMDFDKAFGEHSHEHFMNIHDDVVLQGAINNLSFTYPAFSMLTQPELLREDMFCDENNRPDHCNPNDSHCTCIHRLKIELHSLVELYILDLTPEVNTLNHPFHLHGYQMYVMEMGQNLSQPITIERAQNIARAQELRRTVVTNFPPSKDTVSIPSKGYTRLRFRADNPGFWLMHCHFEWHTAVGMVLVVQVGEPEDFVRAPENFPTCNKYQPDVDESLFS